MVWYRITRFCEVTDAPVFEAAPQAPDNTNTIDHSLGGTFDRVPVSGDQLAIARERGLKVPPSCWDLWMSDSPEAKVLAKYTDAAGRRQYCYNPDFTAQRDVLKHDKITDFRRILPRLRQRVISDLGGKGLSKQRVVAAIVRLIDKTSMRVGGEDYAEKHQHYGAASLRSSHAVMNPDGTVTFDFIGKEGKPHRYVVRDDQLASVLAELSSLPSDPNGRLFRSVDKNGVASPVTDTAVRHYLSAHNIHPHQFRTNRATQIAVETLLKSGVPVDIRQRRAAVTEAAKRAAEALRNTPAQAKSSYINPGVINAYMEGRLDEYLKEIKWRKVKAQTEMKVSQSDPVDAVLDYVGNLIKKGIISDEPDEWDGSDDDPEWREGP